MKPSCPAGDIISVYEGSGMMSSAFFLSLVFFLRDILHLILFFYCKAVKVQGGQTILRLMALLVIQRRAALQYHRAQCKGSPCTGTVYLNVYLGMSGICV